MNENANANANENANANANENVNINIRDATLRDATLRDATLRDSYINNLNNLNNLNNVNNIKLNCHTSSSSHAGSSSHPGSSSHAGSNILSSRSKDFNSISTKMINDIFTRSLTRSITKPDIFSTLPPMDMTQDQHRVHISLDIPGFTLKEISLSLTGSTLLVKASTSTLIGNLPCNSGKRSDGFASWNEPDAINKI